VDGPVKTPRRDGRQAQARATRRRIVDAAHELFLADGYAATTLDAVAARAGVAVQTVYFHFRNKRTVLKHVVDIASVGDDEQVALLERPWQQQMREAPDAAGAVAVWMRMSREVYERIVPIMRVVHEASGSDPDMAEQRRTSKEQTLRAHRALAEHLHERGALREDLDVDTAGEVLYTLVSLEVHLLTTAELGWSAQRWERWACDTVVRAVLRPH
jgi:AcrR family transcriptional regulator